MVDHAARHHHAVRDGVLASYKVTRGQVTGLRKCSRGSVVKSVAVKPSAADSTVGKALVQDFLQTHKIKDASYDLIFQQEMSRVAAEVASHPTAEGRQHAKHLARQHQSADERVHSMEWLRPNADGMLPRAQCEDFISTLRGGPHGDQVQMAAVSTKSPKDCRPRGTFPDAPFLTNQTDLSMMSSAEPRKVFVSQMDNSFVVRHSVGTALFKKAFVQHPSPQPLSGSVGAAVTGGLE